ncbi:paraquat-inducible protein A [Zooshikella ganghwensis]
MFLPIMSLEMLGQSQFDTVFAGIATLFAHDIWWAALLVLFCSMLAPLFKKLLLLYVLLGIKCAWSKPPLARAFSWYQHLDSWAMLEVYMLGVLVSVVKLIDLAAIQFGLGLVCFIALMICSMATGVVLDHHLIWHKLEQFPNQPKAAG